MQWSLKVETNQKQRLDVMDFVDNSLFKGVIILMALATLIDN